MNKKTIFCINKRIRMMNIDNIKLVANIDILETFETNSLGKDILDLIDGEKNIANILEVLRSYKKYKNKDIEKKVLNFLSSCFKDKKIIELKN